MLAGRRQRRRRQGGGSRIAGMRVAWPFRYQDDILDVAGRLRQCWAKPAGSDEKNEKATYVAFEGLDAVPGGQCGGIVRWRPLSMLEASSRVTMPVRFWRGLIGLADSSGQSRGRCTVMAKILDKYYESARNDIKEY